MTSNQIREEFLRFFESKQHEIVTSAPIVVKNDPTLMFINAGMNQFKDIFLGNRTPTSLRVADTQKCLRVSGKHNDLEEVGRDTYHHTMFEMLGNWSFGDYFKKEAIDFAWEFLHDRMGISEDRMYVTVFGGDVTENLERDHEAAECWKKYLPAHRILNGSKKDNFWEMGDQGPCGPCSEIHVDLRDDDEREKIPGHEMVNKDHPQVIEIWNLVFIQFNRKADGKLETLPQKHVDTGMGFERLCMVLQGKKSNYDTDVFMPLIQAVSDLSGIKYGSNHQSDIAMRVIADHLRAISFSIADGQLPSNVKAGYVIRRILRRAVRYGYTFLNFREPFISKLIPILVQQMGNQFKELEAQKELITKVINEEETAFLRTLANGISRLEQMMLSAKNDGKKEISGADAFELFDTYGFPFDLTELILSENNLSVNKQQFDAEMQQQKERSRNAASKNTSDWVEVHQEETPTIFVGYDDMECDVKILRYRKVVEKAKTFYQLVFDKTPFFAESGGQVGDTGVLESETGSRITIFDTKKENTLIVHLTETLPEHLTTTFHATVDLQKRQATANNHTATHLLHFALRKILGSHVEQKGSMVSSERLRFDFSHFQKLSDEELKMAEKMVNQLIRKNIPLDEHRNMPIKEAEKMGAMALFGEKYGDYVRVVRYGDSVEFCGGTHIRSTGEIGQFHILTESAIAAGIRRIEAITAENAENFFNEKLALLEAVTEQFKGTKDVLHSVQKLNEEHELLKKEMAALKKNQLLEVKKTWKEGIQNINGINSIALITDLDAAAVKELAFQLKAEIENNLFMIIGSKEASKATITILISDNLVKEKELHAGNLVREWSKEINGGGGGQPFFATAGGKNPEGLEQVIKKAQNLIANL